MSLKKVFPLLFLLTLILSSSAFAEKATVSGGQCNPGGGGKNPCPGFHDGSANSMAANVDIDKTQNSRWWKCPD